jgi:hypothetical protein
VKNKKQQQDLDRMRQEQNHQQYQPQSQQAPLDQLKKQLDSLEQDIKKQELETETTLQGTFSQAVNGLGDTQAISQLMQITNSLKGLVETQGLQGSANQYTQLLGDLESDLRQQIQSGTQQVVQNLQQSVTALAQANAALLDSHNYNQMLQYVNQSRLLLANWEAGSTQLH